MPKEETALQRCVNSELDRYFEMLDGEVPHDLHRMVMRQVESALISYVLAECRGNQSKAAQWLGISRGTLRGKIADSQNAARSSGLSASPEAGRTLGQGTDVPVDSGGNPTS